MLDIDFTRQSIQNSDRISIPSRNFSKRNSETQKPKPYKPDLVETNKQDSDELFDIDIVKHVEEQKEKKEVILLRAHPKKSNRYIFKLLPDDKEFTRKLTDLYWLRSNLAVEFPFYYIPPVKAVDNKENFIQNFFAKLMDMKFINDSEIMETFLDETKFSKIRAKEISSLDKVMLKKFTQTYNDSENKNYFKKNEFVYDDNLSKLFKDYKKHKQNMSYFNALFRHFEGFGERNSQIFSQLKHLSYDLADLLGETGKKIH